MKHTNMILLFLYITTHKADIDTSSNHYIQTLYT